MEEIIYGVNQRGKDLVEAMNKMDALPDPNKCELMEYRIPKTRELEPISVPALFPSQATIDPYWTFIKHRSVNIDTLEEMWEWKLKP